MRTLVDLPHAYRLINHGPVTLVSSAYAGAQNVMAAAWAMPLDFDPPKVAVVIDANTYTRQLVEGSGEFALNIPCWAIAGKVLKAGAASGRDVDKFAHTVLGKFQALQIGAPLVEDCVAWLECRVLPRLDNQQRHDLFLAEVVAAQADDRVFRGIGGSDIRLPEKPLCPTPEPDRRPSHLRPYRDGVDGPICERPVLSRPLGRLWKRLKFGNNLSSNLFRRRGYCRRLFSLPVWFVLARLCS